MHDEREQRAIALLRLYYEHLLATEPKSPWKLSCERSALRGKLLRSMPPAPFTVSAIAEADRWLERKECRWKKQGRLGPSGYLGMSQGSDKK